MDIRDPWSPSAPVLPSELGAVSRIVGGLVHQMPAVMWSVDRELRFTASVGGGLAALGLEAGQVVGMDLFEYFGTDDPSFPAIAQHHNALAGSETWYEFEWQGRTLLNQLAPLRDEQDAIVGVIGLAIDITDRVDAEQDLRRTIAELRASDQHRRDLLAQLVVAQEDEHRRIAAEVHDGAVQKMTAAGLRLKALERWVSEPEGGRVLGEVRTSVDQATRELRRLLSELMPASDGATTFVDAIRNELEALREESGLEHQLQSELAEDPPEPMRTTAFRMVQEALRNIRKHSGAGRLQVRAWRQGEDLRVRITDDGIGFEDHPSEPGHIGLSAMRNRAESAGGWLVIDTAAGQGTTVEFAIPLNGPGAAPADSAS